MSWVKFKQYKERKGKRDDKMLMFDESKAKVYSCVS